MSKDARLPDGRVLVVGLGNPGSKYDGTRHNIGFRVVDELARRWGISLHERKFKAILGAGIVAQRPCVLLLPQTYMNLSGESVQAAAHFYKLGSESVVVAHDDIDLDPGKVKMKVGGGHGRHNGLRSCDKQANADVANWVLGHFGDAESRIVEHLIDTGADAVEALLREGLLEAQGRIHPLPVPALK